LLIGLYTPVLLKAQYSSIGIEGGGFTYFGDLNQDEKFNLTKFAGGVLYKYSIDNRISFKTMLNAGMISGSDQYQSTNYYQRLRNLSFFSDIFEVSEQVEFNFLPFSPNNPKNIFTPYFLLGFGIFHFNPETFYDGHTYLLQPLGTEGQGLPEYPDLKKYPLISTEFLIGGGFKFRLSRHWSTFIEIAQRKTHTNYLDDVGGVYANPVVLLNEHGSMGSVVAALSDRSAEVVGEPAFAPGTERSNNNRDDDYLFSCIGIVYTINPYRCPSPGNDFYYEK
jgi:hypothetical protein